MQSKPTSVVGDACARRARFLIGYTRRLDSKCNSDADRNQVFAGAYVAYLGFFEQQLEELFIGLMTARYVHPSRLVQPLVEVPRSSIAKSLITGGRNYVDWLPFDQHTKKRAPAFLRGGEPFSSLSSADRNALDRASVLRNALAHQSDHSQRQFERVFTAGKPLRTAEQRPGGYLRGFYSPAITRFEIQLQELVGVMSSLTR